ncbi:YggT family protein [Entomospira entomophila]|uniref:YggT family protein n=1 Tax=Entomospira entomophila TaxID=2719988 RepID=A0A968G7V3_9SPIO|nr:YggT family protein [Entomospira entomophilus]NIZ40188.1 YggT family protein [Entomospira entomophilus]WDI35747.1 YggT family protein [Entomospira entomophilus]
MSGQILQFLAGFLGMYKTILFITAIVSWIPSLRQSMIAQMLYVITEPYIRLFRFSRFSRIGVLDIAFIWAVFFVQVMEFAVQYVLQVGYLNPVVLLLFILRFMFSIGNFILIALIVMSVVRLFMYHSNSPQAGSINYTLDTILQPLIGRMRGRLAPKKYISPKVLLIYLLIVLVIFWSAWSFLFNVIMRLLRVLY